MLQVNAALSNAESFWLQAQGCGVKYTRTVECIFHTIRSSGSANCAVSALSAMLRCVVEHRGSTQKGPPDGLNNESLQNKYV